MDILQTFGLTQTKYIKDSQNLRDYPSILQWETVTAKIITYVSKDKT